MIAAIGIVARPWTTLFAVVLAVIGLVLVLFGNSLFRSRVVGAVVTIVLGALALLYGLFVHGLGTAQVLLWLGVGVLLLFAGVARVTTRLVPPLSKVLSPVARWAMLVLMIVALPIWLPIWGLYWLYRYAAFTPGLGRLAHARASILFVVTILNPIALIVAIMWIRKAAFGWQPEWPVQFPRFLPERESTQLGGENSRRNPQRTASTAAALMIGLALVTLVADARGRHRAVVHGRGQRHLHRRLLDHGAEQLRSDPDLGRRGRRKGARRDGGRQRPHGRRARLRQDDLRHGGRSRGEPGDHARLGRGLAGDVRRTSGRTAPSSTRTTRSATTSRWARRSTSPSSTASPSSSRSRASSTRRRAARRSGR